MKVVWRNGSIALFMEVSGKFYSAATLPPCRFPRVHGIGGWVDPRVGLDAMEKIHISCPYREPNRDSLVVQLVA
jgi:hypothetical protein